MKQIFKRFIKCLCAFLFMIGTSSFVPIEAEQLSHRTSSYTYHFTDYLEGIEVTLKVKSLNGEYAYCVQPYTAVSFEDVYQRIALQAWEGASSSDKTQIALISAFGCGYTNRGDDLYYAAAQDLIWKILGTDVVWADENAIALAGNEIMSSVNQYQKRPDFTIIDTLTSQQVGTVYAEGVLDRTYQIIDRAGALAGMGKIAYDKLDHTDSGNPNVLNISVPKANTVGTVTVQTAEQSISATEPLILYGENGADVQMITVRGTIAPASYQIQLKGTETTVEFDKTDESDQSQKDASLILKNSNGSQIDAWNTDGETHRTVLPLASTNQIQELDAPDGYYCKDYIVNVDEDSASLVHIQLKNDDLIQYEVLKKDENGDPVKGASLALYDVTDGNTVLVPIDDRIGNPWITDGSPREISQYLHAGHSYSIVEEDASLKYFLAEDYSFTVSKYAPQDHQMIAVEIIDDHISYRFNKIDENGNPVEGAQLKIYDVNDHDREVFSFTSGLQPSVTGLLERGGTYRLVETKTPDGSYTMEEKTFTVPLRHNSEPITITGIDETIVYQAMKIDETGNPVLNAGMEVHDITDGKDILLQSFVSQEEPIQLTGMIVGHTYVLKEIMTPKGYYTAEEKVFTIPARGTADPITITAIDHRIVFHVLKTNTDGHPLSGITLTLKDAETEEILGTWITAEDTEIDVGSLVEEGKTYLLEETEVIDGYYRSKQMTFTVPDEYQEDAITSITMIDESIRYSVLKEDEKGNVLEGAHLQLYNAEQELLDEWDSTSEAHEIGYLLHIGNNYTIKETYTVNGYYYAQDTSFTVNEYASEEPIVIHMIDDGIHYAIAKVSEDGNPIAGVHLVLKDAENDELIGEWDTEDTKIILDNVLSAGHTYVLSETEWIAGVQKAQDMTFTVPLKGNAFVTMLLMVDETNAIAFRKTDPEGNSIPDAKLQILDEDKNVIAEFYSTDSIEGVSYDAEGVLISSLLVGGSEYCLHEAETPFGYAAAEDVRFTMSGTFSSPQIVQMIDMPMNLYVRVRKTSVQTQVPLKDCGLTVYHQDTDEAALNIHGEQADLVTAEDGTAMIALPYSKAGYYVKEVVAPSGYSIDDSLHEVQTETHDVFDEDTPVLIEVKDEKEINTGVDLSIPWILFGLAVISAAAAVIWNPHE